MVGIRFYILLGNPYLTLIFKGKLAVSFREDIVSLRNSGVTLGLDSVYSSSDDPAVNFQWLFLVPLIGGR